MPSAAGITENRSLPNQTGLLADYGVTAAASSLPPPRT